MERFSNLFVSYETIQWVQSRLVKISYLYDWICLRERLKGQAYLFLRIFFHKKYTSHAALRRCPRPSGPGKRPNLSGTLGRGLCTGICGRAFPGTTHLGTRVSGMAPFLFLSFLFVFAEKETLLDGKLSVPAMRQRLCSSKTLLADNGHCSWCQLRRWREAGFLAISNFLTLKM